MKPDLSFLAEQVRADPVFKRCWRVAVRAVHAAAQADLDLSSVKKKESVQSAAKRTIDAATLLRDEIDAGAFAQRVVIDEFAKNYGFSSDDVKTVRRFHHLLRYEITAVAHQTVEQIPTIKKREANPTAGWFAGRLCAEFNLGAPKKYASEDLSRANVAVRLMRCLLLDSKADNKPSRDTLLRGMVSANEGFAAFLECKTSSSE